MNPLEKISASCWEKLYLGLLDELVSLPEWGMSTDTVRNYRFAAGYAFGRYKEQERKARG